MSSPALKYSSRTGYASTKDTKQGHSIPTGLGPYQVFCLFQLQALSFPRIGFISYPPFRDCSVNASHDTQKTDFTVEKSQQRQSWFFENVNNIDKLLSSLIKKKGEREKIFFGRLGVHPTIVE